MSLIAPAIADALEHWLASLSAVEGAAEKTVEAYRADLLGFLAFIGGYKGGAAGLGPLSQITVTDMRAWMAHERDRGLSARSLARALSAVKTFFRWLAEREGFDPTAVLSARTPKYQRKLPRPLAITLLALLIAPGWAAAQAPPPLRQPVTPALGAGAGDQAGRDRHQFAL